MFTTCYVNDVNMFCFKVYNFILQSSNLKCSSPIELVKQRALDHFKLVMSGIIPKLDEIVEPVLRCGRLARSQVPRLVFDDKSLKQQHKLFPMYNELKDLQSVGKAGEFGPLLFEFFFKLVVWSFLVLPFMGDAIHEVVEVIWSSLMTHDSWVELVREHSVSSDPWYLLVNFVVRYTVRAGVTNRRFFFTYLYRESLPNELQSTIFKVSVHVNFFRNCPKSMFFNL